MGVLLQDPVSLRALGSILEKLQGVRFEFKSAIMGLIILPLDLRDQMEVLTSVLGGLHYILGLGLWALNIQALINVSSATIGGSCDYLGLAG